MIQSIDVKIGKLQPGKVMIKSTTLTVLLLMGMMLFNGCASTKTSVYEPPVEPYAEREFRAAWVATVANINWPSKPGLTSEQQQAEAVAILDRLLELNFNAVVFQVRPQCDALYASDLEPWSYFLTGLQGQPPDPYYDPLEFWIDESHKRGLELHAWLNPYRAHHVAGGPVSEHSLVKRRPDLALNLSSGYWWLDPAKPGTQEHSIAVVLDIIERYEVDAIHFDDYFYPYPSYHDGDFPDDESWTEYQQGGGKLSQSDWRRASVDQFVERLYKEIKAADPRVKFGLSPFGIWRPNYPESIRGFDQYDQLYADARLWLREGWLDYWSPQLYWPISQVPQSYPVLLNWWQNENPQNRHIWPGLNSNRRGAEGAGETINQVMVTKGFLPASPGNIHFSYHALVSNQALASGLVKGPYRKPALVPSSPWLDKSDPAAPEISLSLAKDSTIVTWTHQRPEDVFRWVLYYKHGNRWDYTILNQADRTYKLPLTKLRYISDADLAAPDSINVLKALDLLNEVRITAVDRMGNESDPVVMEVLDNDYIGNLTGYDIVERYASDHPSWYWKQRSSELEAAFPAARVYQDPLKELRYSDVDSMLLLLEKNYPDQFIYEQLGTSVEGRPINLMQLGSGETRILLWSQMHGDEPTATAALFDVFNYLCANPDDPSVEQILENTTILAIPMLNPDGAQRFNRRNAQGIDINRDARDLQTPEGQILFQAKEKYQPRFGFNLHDMSTRETVGKTDKLVALALMAPPINMRNDSNPTLIRAKQLMTVIMDVLNPFMEGHIAKYDADYMPRAFGDSMQSWGISTVLIESAGWFGEADTFLQKTNFIAYLAAFEAIATGRYSLGDPDRYDQLPVNDRDMYDLVYQDITVVDGTGNPGFRADLAVNFYNGRGRIVDLGDLNIFAAKDTVSGDNLFVAPGFIGVMDTENKPISAIISESRQLLKRGYTTLIYAVPWQSKDLRVQLDTALEESNYPGNWIMVAKISSPISGSTTRLALLEQVGNYDGILVANEVTLAKELAKYTDKPIINTREIGDNYSPEELDAQKIHQITLEPSQQWRLTGKGMIRSGKTADLIVFETDPRGKTLVKQVFVGGRPIQTDK